MKTMITRKIREDKMTKWFPVVLLVTLLLVTVLVILWSILVGLSPSFPERWICWNIFHDNSSTLSNNNATFLMATTKINASQKIPNDSGLLLYGPKTLNDRWCEDINVDTFPLMDWSCDDEQKMMKYRVDSLDTENNPNETTTTMVIGLEMVGLSKEIDRLCATIQRTPLVHKIPIVVIVLQLIWGIFLVVVSKIDCEGTTTMAKVLQLMSLLKLSFIFTNVITYIESPRFRTAQLVLFILDICVFITFIKTVYAHRIQQTEKVEPDELEMSEMRTAV